MFSGLQTTTVFLWMFADLGTTMYGIREIAKKNQDPSSIIGSVIAMRGVSASVILVAFVSVIGLYTRDFQIFIASVFAAAHLIFFAASTDWILKGHEHFKWVSVGNLFSGGFLIAAAYFGINSETPVYFATLVWSFSTLVATLVHLYFVRNGLGINVRIIIEMAEWAEHLRSSAFFLIATILAAAHQYLSVILLSTFWGAYELGLFAAPARIIFAFASLGTFIALAFYPTLSRQYEADLGKFLSTARTLRIILISISTLPTLSIVIINPEVFLLVLGNKFTPSVEVFKILIWIIPLLFAHYSYWTVMSASGDVKHLAVIAAISMVVFAVVALPRQRSRVPAARTTQTLRSGTNRSAGTAGRTRSMQTRALLFRYSRTAASGSWQRGCSTALTSRSQTRPTRTSGSCRRARCSWRSRRPARCTRSCRRLAPW